jgi:hypothetical protein
MVYGSDVSSLAAKPIKKLTNDAELVPALSGTGTATVPVGGGASSSSSVQQPVTAALADNAASKLSMRKVFIVCAFS